MRIGIRAKLFLVSMLLIVLVGGASGGYLEFELRSLLEGRIEKELSRLAGLAAEAVRTSDPRALVDPAARSALAERLGRAGRAEITIVPIDQRSISHSTDDDAADDPAHDDPSHDASHGPSHGPSLRSDESRPPLDRGRVTGLVGSPSDGVKSEGRAGRRLVAFEDIELEGGVVKDAGVSSLRGASQGSVQGSAQDSVQGSVRDASRDRRRVRVLVSVSSGDVEEVVRRLRLMIMGASLLGLVISVGMSGLASHMISTMFRMLVDNTRALAQGASRRLDVETRDEIGHLAGSINKMAEDLARTVAALAAERDRFETVLQGMSEALLAIDDEQVVTVVNPAMRALLGPSKVAEGYRLAEVARVPALLELVTTARAGPAATEFTLPGDVERRVLARATPLRASGGMVVVMLDVTEMRRLERIRKDFVANVSHELRTPVSIIRANAETLLSGALAEPERARAFVEAQLRSVDRLSSLVADLLDLARIEAGKFRLEIDDLPLGPVLESAREAVRMLAEKKQLRLETEIDGDADLRVRADSKALDQILLNLVDNAAKYAPTGGCVRLRGLRAKDHVRIEVEDDGPGIEPRHRARIFERFYRIDPGRSRDVGGTGLGLAIVKHLTESMGGQVGVEAADPQGSRFWVRLPAASEGEESSTSVGDGPV